MANQEKISHSLHALRRSSSQPPMPDGPLKTPDRIRGPLKAPDRFKAVVRAPDRIWQALKAPDKTWHEPPKAPDKTWKPRPTNWRPAGMTAATTQPAARPPWSPDPEPAPSSGARRYRPGLDG